MITPEALNAVGRDMLGHLDVIAFHDGHRGTPVMRARSRLHGDVIVKIHRDLQRHRQEACAYRTWTSILHERAPRLIAVNADPPAIAITAVSGQALSELSLPAHAERDAYRHAGALMRTLHATGPPKHDPNFRLFLAERGRYWITRAGAQFAAHERGKLENRLERLTRLPVNRLTPCHLDFMPRNLLRDHDGMIRVIDFEHARYDLPARDLVRLATRIWPSRPDLEHAFLASYGQLTELDRMVIDCCSAIDTVSQSASPLPTNAASL